MATSRLLLWSVSLRRVRSITSGNVARSLNLSLSRGVRDDLRLRINTALREIYGDQLSSSSNQQHQLDGIVFPTPKPEFGDYQCNVCMPVAKYVGKKPRDVAQELLARLQLSDLVEDATVAGPGFLNFRLSEEYVKARLANILSDSSKRLGIAKSLHMKRIVVDYSSPNIAKEMHVGHLRSTIIGDALSKILEYFGHDVVRVNHVGDWGTQFGMLIEYLKTEHPDLVDKERGGVGKGGDFETKIGDLVSFYKRARLKFDSDETFRTASRERVVELQRQATSLEDCSSSTGDSETIVLWKEICKISRNEFQEIYDLLGVERLQERGESSYNFLLPDIVRRLQQSGVASNSDGAVCIFPSVDFSGGDSAAAEQLKSHSQDPPLIVQKFDGGFLYATTDLAAVAHRVWVEDADLILYVTDSSQANHFRMVFDAAKRSGLLDSGSSSDIRSKADILPPLSTPANRSSAARNKHDVNLLHVGFGLVLGEDGKKLKSRAGETVRLRDLLDSAVRRAREEIELRQAGAAGSYTNLRSLSSEEICVAAKIIGLGAVKYADLCMNRENNYKFSFAKMLSMNGNTAPYLLYAYARIRGIQRQAQTLVQPKIRREMSFEEIAACLDLGTKEESLLAKHLIRFEEVLLDVERTLLPNQLCEYLYELSNRFNVFYEKCSVLYAASDAQQISRLYLCSLTSDTLKLGLGMLGLDTVEKL